MTRFARLGPYTFHYRCGTWLKSSECSIIVSIIISTANNNSSQNGVKRKLLEVSAVVSSLLINQGLSIIGDTFRNLNVTEALYSKVLESNQLKQGQ